MARKVEIAAFRRFDGMFVASWRPQGETWRATYQGRCAVHAEHDAAVRFAIQLAAIEDADSHGGNYDIEAVLPPATEPTAAGLQYVMPGCEKDQSRGPSQMSLF